MRFRGTGDDVKDGLVVSAEVHDDGVRDFNERGYDRWAIEVEHDDRWQLLCERADVRDCILSELKRSRVEHGLKLPRTSVVRRAQSNHREVGLG